ncbi:TetR/AcrR family transcriptional regulator [Limosilactobacillus fermentum]|uniref:TetR/AcrR family transcriptional regulator n=1 Tax=Limosilactobacillus fermentum TaxID=1613 RepID=UPI002079D39B|nr:TetR/AcrR family transcriptional regulator [Limosilactobacillus fermentum]
MKREEQVRLTKQKLLTAADQLIVKEGYAAVSVERITKLAGVSKGTFYTYFKKKGDLMIALSQHRFAAINDQIPLLVNGDPVEGIRHYLMSYLKVVTDQSTSWSGVGSALSWTPLMDKLVSLKTTGGGLNDSYKGWLTTNV